MSRKKITQIRTGINKTESRKTIKNIVKQRVGPKNVIKFIKLQHSEKYKKNKDINPQHQK